MIVFVFSLARTRKFISIFIYTHFISVKYFHTVIGPTRRMGNMTTTLIASIGGKLNEEEWYRQIHVIQSIYIADTDWSDREQFSN